MAGDDFAASFAGPGPSDCHAVIARDFLPKPGGPPGGGGWCRVSLFL